MEEVVHQLRVPQTFGGLRTSGAYEKVMSRTLLRALLSSDSQGFEVSYGLSSDSHSILPSITPDNAHHLFLHLWFMKSRLQGGYFCHIFPSWCQAQSILRIAKLTGRLRFRRAHLLRISVQSWKWSRLNQFSLIRIDSVRFSWFFFFFAM